MGWEAGCVKRAMWRIQYAYCSNKGKWEEGEKVVQACCKVEYDSFQGRKLATVFQPSC